RAARGARRAGRGVVRRRLGDGHRAGDGVAAPRVGRADVAAALRRRRPPLPRQIGGLAEVTRKVGVWLIGAYGNVATCAVAGAAAVARGLLDATGLGTETPALAGLGLAPVPNLVFGGHDVRDGSLVRSAKEFGDRNGLLTPELRRAVAADLRRADREVRCGVLLHAGDTVTKMASDAARRPASLAASIARVQTDLR